MSFIVNTWTPEARTAAFSRSSRLRMPMSTVCCGQHLGREAADRASSAGSGAEQRRERHAVHVAARRRRRRVHVAVRVDPDQAERLVRAPREARPRAATEPAPRLWSPPSTSGMRAVVERRAATRRRAAGRRARSRATYFLRRIAGAFVSGIGAARSPLSTTVVAERREPFAECRRCGTPTVPCRRRGGCRRGRAERR